MAELNIGFPLDLYPTLQRASYSDALVRLALGPAGCLPKETEVLTRNGWQNIADPTHEALVYCPRTQTAYFAPVEHIALPEPSGFWRIYNSHSVDMVVSDEHKVWYQTYYEYSRHGKNAAWVVKSGREIGEHIAAGTSLNARIPATFAYTADTSYPATDDELRLYVAICADGHIPKRSKQVKITLRKERKKERLALLLDRLGIPYTKKTYPYRPTETIFSFHPKECDKDLRRFYKCDARQLGVIAEECLFWDGNKGAKGAYFTSALKSQVDFIQFAFAATGYPSIITCETYEQENWSDCYRATFGENKKNAWVNLKTCKAERVPSSDGMKYCLITPTGMFIARHNGKIFATGNSAKTSWAIMELLRTAMLQEPSSLDNTRYTRMLVVRNTYSLLKSNTIPSMRNMLGPLLQVTEGSQPTGKVRAQLGDGTMLNMDIQFLALDSEDAQDKLLGAEPTMVLCDELNMMPESVVFALVRRLGRYPSGTKGRVTRTGIIGVFNGPVKGSWLHRWYLGERDREFEQTARQMGVSKFVEFFKQPPALIPPPGYPNSHDHNAEWTPNPLAENIHNLAQGYGYYYAMLADPDPGKIQSYVMGDFADVKHGKVVFPEFHRDVHTFPAQSVNTHELREYYLSFDFGRTPVCIVGYLAPDGSLLVLDEFMGEDMSVDTLYRTEVLPALKQRYPNAVCAKAWGDPAGMVQGQNLDLSMFDVLRRLGVPITAPTRSNKLEPRLQAVRSFMTALGHNGKPRLRIRDNCKFLVQAMAADYIYENRGSGGTHDTPTKSHVGWVSDLCVAEGTLIATPRGNIPIEQIKVGDEVYTRNGVRKVLAAEMTGVDSLCYEYDIGGVKLLATPNHPVFADGKFYAIDSLAGSVVDCELLSPTSKPVRVRVSRGEQKNVTVYNLTVEHDNEYYANGVLVHNCDSLQYLSLGCLRIVSDREDDVRPTRDEDIDWYA